MRRLLMKINIYMSGVGGQGIGVLSEVLIRAYNDAGYNATGVDTHGLAQRGGMVESHLRIGAGGGNPLIEKGHADIALCLERTEAYRVPDGYLKRGGSLIYYDTSWQSLAVRLGPEKEITAEEVKAKAEKNDIQVYRVFSERLKDARMQNIGLITGAIEENLLPGLGLANIENALKLLFTGSVLEENLKILEPAGW
jgi:indolepyruvate ferredoxin oxidoreductase beta subunit